MIILTALLFGLMASSASALTASYGGASDPTDTLHGATGSLDITLRDGTVNTYDVVWAMDFDGEDGTDGYEGATGDHKYLTHIAFKAFHEGLVATLDSTIWTPEIGGIAIVGNVNNAGCVGGPSANMVCVDLMPNVDATMGGEFIANFTVIGDLDLSSWSYRGKFGEEDGWVISESAAPIPEPSAALVFAAGLVVASVRMRPPTFSRR